MLALFQICSLLKQPLCVMMAGHGIHMDMAQPPLVIQHTLSDKAQLVSISNVMV